MPQPPELIAIDHDDYHAKYVGRTEDGRQFFRTNPFVPEEREFDALYLFDEAGDLLEARIDNLGTRADLESNLDAARQLRSQKIADLGPSTQGRIVIKPFQLERFDATFGLVVHSPEEYFEGDETPEEKAEIMESGFGVTVEPGNYMAFHEPWDSGEYDT